jgi:caspase domain-containing protein
MGKIMPRIRKPVLLALILFAFAFGSGVAQAEKRTALVIGNANYQAGALTTPANDAGLIAQTLQASGFDVVGARDLDQDSLRRAFRDFLEKASGAGPDTVVFVYVGGYGVQLEGENYFVPIDAKIARDSDVAAEALRLSDYLKPLAALKSSQSSGGARWCRTAGRAAPVRENFQARRGGDTLAGDAVKVSQHQRVGEEDRVIEERLRHHQAQAHQRAAALDAKERIGDLGKRAKRHDKGKRRHPTGLKAGGALALGRPSLGADRAAKRLAARHSKENPAVFER